MKRKIKIILFFWIIICSFYSRAQDTTQLLTLDDCVRIGLQNASRIISGEDSVKLAGIALMAAYGQFLPDLNLNGNDTYISGTQLLTIEQPTIINSQVNELNYQLTSSLNIFNGLKDYSELKANVLNKDAANYSLQRATQAVTFDITQSYLQIVLDSQVVNYAIKNLDVSNKRQSQIADEVRVGRLAISDLLQQEAETSQDKLYLTQSREKLINDRVTLLQKLRVTLLKKYSFADVPIDTSAITIDYYNQYQLIGEAINYRPDLKAANLNIEMANWEIKENQSGYYPKLNLTGGLFSTGGYFYYLSINGEPQELMQQPPLQAYLGHLYGEAQLTLTWTIFNRLATKASVENARVNESLTKLAYDNLSLDISATIIKAYNSYASASQQLQTATKGLVSSDSSFHELQDRYNVGNSSFIELSNAQVTDFQAMVSKEQAAVNLMLQKLAINYYVGK